jgi:hypothetical protein
VLLSYLSLMILSDDVFAIKAAVEMKRRTRVYVCVCGFCFFLCVCVILFVLYTMLSLVLRHKLIYRVEFLEYLTNFPFQYYLYVILRI